MLLFICLGFRSLQHYPDYQLLLQYDYLNDTQFLSSVSCQSSLKVVSATGLQEVLMTVEEQR